jgi:hypothetical protein
MIRMRYTVNPFFRRGPPFAAMSKLCAMGRHELTGV